MAKTHNYKPKENKYPYTLKEFTGGPVLKNNGKPFKFGTVIPLIGGMSLGCSLATNKKPDFMLTYSGFMGNEKSLIDYWKDVPYYNLDEFEYEIPEYANEESEEEKRSLTELAKHFKDVDFINAVPPCAGLSQLNASTNKDSALARGSDAIQNQWMYKTAYFTLKYIKPKVLWGENAPGLFTNLGKGVAEKLAKIAKEYGYSFSMIKTNSLYHGVPQKRERTFYFFWNSAEAPILNYVAKQHPHLSDYLKQIPKGTMHDVSNEWTGNNDSPLSYRYLLEKYGKTHEEWMKENCHSTCHGLMLHWGILDEAIKEIPEMYKDEDQKRIDWELKQLNHIKKKIADGKGFWDASPHMFYDHTNAMVGRNLWQSLHPYKKRFLNGREVIWLMGHPFDFNVLEDGKGNVPLQQISQNVPVVTASHWALEVMKFINGELQFSGESVYRQNNKDGQKQKNLKPAKNLF